jgi:hypothetical protein
MPIKGPAATRMTIRYIERAAQFKEAVRRGHIRQNEFKQRKDAFQDFYSERHGERKGKRTSEIDYFSYHGLIVDELHAVRKKLPFSKGAKPAKNYFVDLAVRSGNDLVEIYEVKTSSSRQNVYHAIGQLLVHGKANPCKRVIVLPDTEALKHDLESALQRLRIEIWKFKLGRNNKVTIVR